MNGELQNVSLPGETAPSYVIERLTSAERGVYSCSAHNVLDHDNSSSIIVSIDGERTPTQGCIQGGGFPPQETILILPSFSSFLPGL